VRRREDRIGPLGFVVALLAKGTGAPPFLHVAADRWLHGWTQGVSFAKDWIDRL
jgi:hypothetical protein